MDPYSSNLFLNNFWYKYANSISFRIGLQSLFWDKFLPATAIYMSGPGFKSRMSKALRTANSNPHSRRERLTC